MYCPNPDCDSEIEITDDNTYGGEAECPKCHWKLELGFGTDCGTYVENILSKPDE